MHRTYMYDYHHLSSKHGISLLLLNYNCIIPLFHTNYEIWTLFQSKRGPKNNAFLTSAEANILQIGPCGNQTVPYGDWNKTFIATWHSNVKVNLRPNVSLSLKQTH